MGLPGKRDDPMRAGMTAIVFMKMSCDELMVEYKKVAAEGNALIIRFFLYSGQYVLLNLTHVLFHSDYYKAGMDALLVIAGLPE